MCAGCLCVYLTSSVYALFHKSVTVFNYLIDDLHGNKKHHHGIFLWVT